MPYDCCAALAMKAGWQRCNFGAAARLALPLSVASACRWLCMLHVPQLHTSGIRSDGSVRQSKRALLHTAALRFSSAAYVIEARLQTTKLECLLRSHVIVAL